MKNVRNIIMDDDTPDPDEFEISNDLRLQFELRNKDMVGLLASQIDQTTQAILEIQAMQSHLSVHLTEQSEKVDNLFGMSEKQTEDVGLGVKQLSQMETRNSFWILYTFLVASLALLLVDYIS